ncbi:MAG: RloB domain-containing protein [Prevotella sp.]|nr:RloB domain-containing protein [Prevotella sp.]
MRQRKDFTRSEGKKSARLVIIATEGTDTEPIYFEAVKANLCSSNVHVEVLERTEGGSNPENVYHQLQSFKDEYNIEDDDELWVVVDRDKWTEKMLSEVALYCHQDSNLKFCVSNPCFELWLLLHLDDITSYSPEELQQLRENRRITKTGPTWLKHKMRQLLGSYSESNYDVYRILPTIDTAIVRAVTLDVNPTDRWPQDIGTRVYLLVRSIMGKNQI